MWHADQDPRFTGMARARRPLIVAAIIGGAILQHILVTAPPAPAPTSPAPVRPTPVLHSAPPPAPAAAHPMRADTVLASAIWRGFNAFALPYQEHSALIMAVAYQTYPFL